MWEGTDSGNSVVNTAWAEGNSTCETSLKGSITENLMRQHSTGRVRAVSNVLCICSFKKKSYNQKIVDAQRITDEKPLLF